jgi:hypothetical protein
MKRIKSRVENKEHCRGHRTLNRENTLKEGQATL